MIRALCFVAFLSLAAPPVWANARVTILMDVLKLSEVVDIMRIEGAAYAEVLEEDMLGGEGGPFWRSQVAQIYDADRLAERVRSGIEATLAPDEIDAAIDFFGSEEGSQILDLENAARRAMIDPAVEDAATAYFDERAAADDPRIAQIENFIAVNDLVERNVSGAMTSNFQFFMALSDGRYTTQTEEQIIAEVWAQQEDIRTDTLDWLEAFLFMAYQPLSDAVMQDYIDYSQSPAGQALNAALFASFDAVYSDVSYALGRAIALNAKVDDI